MGCSSCGKGAAKAVQYPRSVVLPDGSRAEVSSAADERVQRARATQRMRDQAALKGYTATRR